MRKIVLPGHTNHLVAFTDITEDDFNVLTTAYGAPREIQFPGRTDFLAPNRLTTGYVSAEIVSSRWVPNDDANKELEKFIDAMVHAGEFVAEAVREYSKSIDGDGTIGSMEHSSETVSVSLTEVDGVKMFKDTIMVFYAR